MTKMSMEELKERIAVEGVPAFSVWRHKASGKVYLAQGVAFREADMSLSVNYSPLGEYVVVFNRPLAEFRDKFEEWE